VKDRIAYKGNSWGGLTKSGYEAVPVVFLRHASRLGISMEERVLIMVILSYSWDDGDTPYPSKETLAEALGRTPRSIQTYIQALVDKGVVRVVERRGLSNQYDFSPLYQKLRELVASDKALRDEPRLSPKNQGADSPLGGEAADSPPEKETVGEQRASPVGEQRASPEEETPKKKHSLSDLLAGARAAAAKTASTQQANTAKRTATAAPPPADAPSPASPRPAATSSRSPGWEKFEAKKPHEYNANDLYYVIATAWRAKWPNSKPGFFQAKDRALGKLLLDDYGGEVVAYVLAGAIARWEELRQKFRITGYPSVAVFYGFRNSIFPLLLEPGSGSPGPAPAGSQYNQQHARPKGHEEGWE
jgi:hypothetical protein